MPFSKLRARVTASTSSRPGNGFKTYAIAPTSRARSKPKELSCPVMKITGSSAPASMSSKPESPGRPMSRIKQAAVVTALVFSSASAEGNAIAKKPAARRTRWIARLALASSSTTTTTFFCSSGSACFAPNVKEAETFWSLTIGRVPQLQTSLFRAFW